MSKIDIGDTLGGDPRKAAFGGAINLQTIEEVDGLLASTLLNPCDALG